MSTEQNKKVEEIIEVYKNEFCGLTEEQATLKLYRKIVELSKYVVQMKAGQKEFEESYSMLFKLLKAYDKNLSTAKGLPSLLLYTRYTDSDIMHEKEFYQDSIMSLQKVLENYKLLAQTLGIDNALDLSHLFTYMLWNGYYSVTKNHCYSSKNRLLLMDLYSFDIIKGRGVCLEYADLLNWYLTICNKNSSAILCKVQKETKSNYKPEINRAIEDFSLIHKVIMILAKGFIRRAGNHAVVLIEEDDKIFAYDPTNLFVLNMIDSEHMKLINGTGQFDIKIFSSFLMLSDFDQKHILEKMLSSEITPAFTRKEIIFSFENMMERIKDNIHLLDDAYENIHSYLEIIDRQTNELGGKNKILKKQLKRNR